MRSAELCEMSRSCQSAMFSMPTTALPRSTRAQPAMRSERIGLRLWGIAEEPFWPLPKASSASRTSVRCRWRTSTANFSSEEPTMARAERKAAWRSRCTTWLAMGSTAEAELGADQLFDPRVDVVVGADGAAQLAHRGGVGHAAQTVEVAGHLEGPHAELHAERDRFGVDAVGATDLHRVAKLEGASLEHLAERGEVALQQLTGALDLQRQAGVEHVGARHAVVDVLRGVADVLGDVGEEGDHVVVGRLLDLGHAGGVEAGPGLDLGQCVVGDLAQAVPGAHRGELDLEPGLQLGLLGPDGAHLG